jgi:ABC-2 type transport system permease protein
MVMFFTFVIPLAGINFYPLLYLLGRTNNIFYAFTPLMGVFIAVPSLLFFNYSLKKYQGTGS